MWGGGNVEKPTHQLVSLESICWCPCIYSYSIPLTVSHRVNIYKLCYAFTTTAWAEVKSLVIFFICRISGISTGVGVARLPGWESDFSI